MSCKTLLLSSAYEVVSFIPEHKMLKLVAKNKVEIISEWNDDVITWSSGHMFYPSIVRLKEPFKRNFYNHKNSVYSFNREAVVRRDNETCQYCGIKISRSKITIDHIIPKSQGGQSTFTNCVVACHSCNSKKANKTPEQAGMVLLSRPVRPCFYSEIVSVPENYWHEDWNSFIKPG
jgi:hypothetical protein